MNLLALLAAVLMGGGAAAQAATPGTTHGILLQRPADAKFLQIPGVPECTSIAPLRGDMAKGSSTLMVRMRSGCTVPYHWHTPTEELLVLQGAPQSQMLGQRPVMLKVGSYSQLPTGHIHRFRCTSKADCLIFLVADAAFDIHFADDAGKEITTDAALAAAKRASKAAW